MLTDFSSGALSTEFRRQFDVVCPDVKYALVANGDPLLHIPAHHPDVGGITVWFDGEEITVGVGESYHLHFECMKHGLGEERSKDSDGVRQAVEWIRSFLADAIVLEVSEVDGMYSGGTTYRIDQLDRASSPSNARWLTWSGPWKGVPIEGAS